MRSPRGPLRAIKISNIVKIDQNCDLFLFCFKTNHFEMKFLILQYWADAIMYNSYIKQIKYLQNLNLGALERPKIVIFGV